MREFTYFAETRSSILLTFTLILNLLLSARLDNGRRNYSIMFRQTLNIIPFNPAGYHERKLINSANDKAN